MIIIFSNNSQHYMMLFKYWDRNFLLFLCLVYSSFLTAEQSIGNPLTLTPTQLQHYEQNNFKILGAIQIDSNADPDYRLIELSGIAWDQDQEELIILSDRGFIIHTKTIFNKAELIDVELLSYHKLKDARDKKLKYSYSDSEGLALINSNNNIKNDTELLISFERKPRVIRYTGKGKFVSNEILPNILKGINNYAAANKALEAITVHKQFNIITGPERPLDKNGNVLSLHNLNDKEWPIEANNDHYGSLVGLTTLPNNKIIALERSFPSVFAGITNVIHLITLEENSLRQEVLLKLKPIDGYFNENFEGITWHEKNRFFMISDDNDNIFQRTILIYFEIPGLKTSGNEQ
jgi:hypothetical protein